MMIYEFPPWLRWVQKKLPVFNIPYLAEQFAMLQVVGYVLILFDKRWFDLFILYPERVFRGEIWRIFTFLLVPYVMNPLFFFFEILFLIYILRIVIANFSELGTFIFLFFSMAGFVLYSLTFRIPLANGGGIFPALIVTAGILAPDEQILYAFFFPLRLKWVAWITFIGTMLPIMRYIFFPGVFPGFVQYLLVQYGVVLLFFYHIFYIRVKNTWRRIEWKMKNRL